MQGPKCKNASPEPSWRATPAGTCTPSPLSTEVTTGSSIIQAWCQSHQSSSLTTMCDIDIVPVLTIEVSSMGPAEKTVGSLAETRLEPRGSVKAPIRITAQCPKWHLWPFLPPESHRSSLAQNGRRGQPTRPESGLPLSLNDHLILCTSFLGVKPRVCSERQEAQGFGTFPALSTAKLKPLTFLNWLQSYFWKLGRHCGQAQRFFLLCSPSALLSFKSRWLKRVTGIR